VNSGIGCGALELALWKNIYRWQPRDSINYSLVSLLQSCGKYEKREIDLFSIIAQGAGIKMQQQGQSSSYGVTENSTSTTPVTRFAERLGGSHQIRDSTR